MAKPFSMFPRLLLMGASVAVVFSIGASGSPQVPAFFVFGDSLVDDGNNNYLTSLAKANYLPYGVDFDGGPSGRFCNGKTIIDFLGELLGLPYVPAYVNTLEDDRSILGGVNYASAAAGILDESGRELGGRFSLRQQVENFRSTLSQLKNQKGEEELGQYLAKSLVMMNLGSNDYLNNYLMPSLYDTSSIFNPSDYAQILISNYTTHIVALHSLGLRKFLIAGIGPLGCMPNQLATGADTPGKCISTVNNMVRLFNMRLRSLVDQLNANAHGQRAIFVYANTFDLFADILANANTYGLRVVDRGCCGIGRNRGQITCLPLQMPCMNRDEYVFWDAFHPTQAVNKIIAEGAYAGPPSVCYPINVKQMAYDA
ncbi:GDSL esterase/lipase At5g08460 [Rhodamnia argentea]|uniref:GDSL esterase/lipase At5g08460 n=1 Tax=Rhodamnia argentea TaxID=178133 RepID=A0A8B8QVA1_9MYRT|nr:GDSL esterase/lipase At5g08460 [Rhodamnia argentea]